MPCLIIFKADIQCIWLLYRSKKKYSVAFFVMWGEIVLLILVELLLYHCLNFLFKMLFYFAGIFPKRRKCLSGGCLLPAAQISLKTFRNYTTFVPLTKNFMFSQINNVKLFLIRLLRVTECYYADSILQNKSRRVKQLWCIYVLQGYLC